MMFSGANALSGQSHSPDLSQSKKMNRFYQKLREQKLQDFENKKIQESKKKRREGFRIDVITNPF